MATVLTRLISHKSSIYVTNGKVLANTVRFLSLSSNLKTIRYTDKHEWVSFNGTVGTVGITNYAQEALGDIVFAQLPEVNSEYDQMDECGALESVKAASELYCPVSGKVTDVNEKLEDMPSLINQSCLDKGWLFKLELSIPDEFDQLMDENEYENFLKEQQDS